MTRERTEGKRMSRHCLAADRRVALGVAPGFWRPYYGEVVTGGAVSERPLLERGAELEDIELVLNGAAAGHGAVLTIEGAAGIGKSRLLGTAAEMARIRGFGVLAAGGHDLEVTLPWGVAE